MQKMNLLQRLKNLWKFSGFVPQNNGTYVIATSSENLKKGQLVGIAQIIKKQETLDDIINGK